MGDHCKWTSCNIWDILIPGGTLQLVSFARRAAIHEKHCHKLFVTDQSSSSDCHMLLLKSKSKEDEVKAQQSSQIREQASHSLKRGRWQRKSILLYSNLKDPTTRKPARDTPVAAG